MVDLSEVFYYDETSPSGLRWKIDVPYKGLFGGSASKVKVGDVAGTKQKSRQNAKYRWKIKYQQKAYMAHRIIYQLMVGPIEKNKVIDHIDGDSTNNIVSNLRVVVQGLNSKNSSMLRSNKTGYTGVCYSERGNYKYYCALWMDLTGKGRYKYFSIAKLGKEEAFRQAIAYRQEQIRLLNEQGAGYTDRHGT